MEKGTLLYEGKAKKIYETDDPNIVWVAYKDDATAFNGEKKAEIRGKGELNNAITSLLFGKLHENGISSHFIQKVSETEQLVKRVNMIPIEVVVRNIAAGSLAKRLGLSEGTGLGQTVIEFYYKNDELGDPLINNDHIALLKLVSEAKLQNIRKKSLEINRVLVECFSDIEIDLVDFKLEFGMTEDSQLLLADEISPDTCRLWDTKSHEKLDKDVFRRNLGDLTTAYREILKRLGGSLHV